MLPSIYLGYDIVKKTMDNSSAEKFITENFDFDGHSDSAENYRYR